MSLSTMAAARQNEMNDSIAVVAMMTLGSTGRCCWRVVLGLSEGHAWPVVVR